MSSAYFHFYLSITKCETVLRWHLQAQDGQNTALCTKLVPENFFKMKNEG